MYKKASANIRVKNFSKVTRHYYKQEAMVHVSFFRAQLCKAGSTSLSAIYSNM